MMKRILAAFLTVLIAIGPAWAETQLGVTLNPIQSTIGNWFSIPLSVIQSGLFTISGMLPAPTSPLQKAVISIAAAGPGYNTIVPCSACGSQTVKMYYMAMTCTSAVTIFFADTTPASLSGSYVLTNNASFPWPYNTLPYFTTAAGQGLSLNLSGASACTGDVWYIQS